MDSIIDAKEFQIERKRFHVEFRENDRGKFLRITEEAHGRRNTIIVPSTGVGDFTAAIGEVLRAPKRSTPRSNVTRVYIKFRRRQSGRRWQHEAAPRRQRREPRGDDAHRPARASGFHDHDRGLHLFLRAQAHLSRRSRPRSRKGVANMERIMGTKFGDTEKMPLLVAVRSGARDSMPGMMDTILNLGLNDETVKALVRATKNERFAWDCYRRFIQMYGDVVMGVQKREGEDHDPFESVIEHFKDERYGQHDIDDSKLTAADYQELVVRFKKLVKDRTGQAFPNDPWDQLKGSVGAVFGSWMNDRAIVYRRKYNIPEEWGTAVNVQAMVYGNTGANSGSGVAFTRNPANGANEFYGEFLINAQGEDVVAGVRTPQPVIELKKVMPKCYAELLKVRATLERHFKDVQDVEFTIQDGKLFMLQTRNGKRTAAAALKFSMDMFKEKLIDWKTAVMRNPADQLDQLLAPIFDVAEVKKAKAIASGLPAGPGAASGKIYLNADRAAAAAEKGEKVLLVRNETSPEDLRGMIAAEGHSHGARRRLVARGAGRAADGQGLHLRRVGVADRLREEDRFRRQSRSSRKAKTFSRSTERPAPFTPASSRPRRAKSSPACCTATRPRRRPRSSKRSTNS